MKLTLLYLMVLSVASCGSGQMGQKTVVNNSDKIQQTSTYEKPDKLDASTALVTGTVSDTGVMCQAMQGDDGELYTFENFPKGLKVGDRIRVKRHESPSLAPSFCDQGITLVWVEMTDMKTGKSYRNDNTGP